MKFFKKSGKRNNDNCRKAKNSLRAARFEALEDRQLLSINTYAVDSSSAAVQKFDLEFGKEAYAEIRAAYPSLDLVQSPTHIVLISGEDLNSNSIENAVRNDTQANTVFVLLTDSENNTLVANDASSAKESVLELQMQAKQSMVVWSGQGKDIVPLTINGQNQRRAAEISNVAKMQGTINLGGLNFVNGNTNELQENKGGGLLFNGSLYSTGSVNKLTLSMENCDFIGNNSQIGGGMYYSSIVNKTDDINLYACNFTNNKGERGAAFDDYIDGTANVNTITVERCSFVRNQSEQSILSSYGKIQVQGSLFTLNTLRGNGGNGVLSIIPRYTKSQSEPQYVVNCTFAYNELESATNTPYAAVYLNNDVNVTTKAKEISFDNCILVENENLGGVEVASAQNINLTARNTVYSNVEWGVQRNSRLYKQGDLLFANPGTEDLTLAQGSYAIDFGWDLYYTSKTLSTIDLIGNARIQGERIDVGAIEGAKAPHVNFKLIVTIDSNAYDHSDDFYPDGTPRYISLRDAYDYIGKRFSQELYSDGGYDYQSAYDCWIECENPVQYPAVYAPDRTFISGVYDCVYFKDYVNLQEDETEPRELASVAFDNEIVLSKSFTIDGTRSKGFENVELNGQEKTRLFTIDGAAVELKNLDCQYGLADFGGALRIESNSAVYATNVNFRKNQALSYGGVVYNKGLFVGNLQNEHNYLRFESNEALLGGGVYNAPDSDFELYATEESEAKFFNCVAKSNDAGKYGSGGAIYNSTKDDKQAFLKLTNVDFDLNSADKYGGAVSNYGIADISGCNFLENTSVAGGAIQNAGNTSLSDSNFENNMAKNGGAVYSSNNATSKETGTLIVAGDCLFSKNAAENAGGAIDVVSGLFAVGSYAQNEQARFVENRAGNFGGAVVLGVDSMQVRLNAENYFSFEGNSATYGNTVAANVKTTEAQKLVKDFGFDYSNVTSDQFATFMKVASDVKDGSLTFDYFCNVVDNSIKTDSIIVSCGGNSKKLTPGQSVSFEELGIEESNGGSYKVNINYSEGTTASLLINTVQGHSVTVRKTKLMNEEKIPSFSFNLYDAAALSWKINWGDGEDTQFYGLSSTFTATHIYEEAKEYTVSVEIDVDGESTPIQFDFLYDIKENVQEHDSNSEDLLLQNSLLDAAFRGYEETL